MSHHRAHFLKAVLMTAMFASGIADAKTLKPALHGVQGPAMLQALNILENFDLESMGYNSSRYIHTLYQAMNLAFADRDFYYGDSYFPPIRRTRICCSSSRTLWSSP